MKRQAHSVAASTTNVDAAVAGPQWGKCDVGMRAMTAATPWPPSRVRRDVGDVRSHMCPPARRSCEEGACGGQAWQRQNVAPIRSAPLQPAPPPLRVSLDSRATGQDRTVVAFARPRSTHHAPLMR